MSTDECTDSPVSEYQIFNHVEQTGTCFLKFYVTPFPHELQVHVVARSPGNCRPAEQCGACGAGCAS